MTLMQYMGIVWLFKHMKPTTSCWRVILSATQLKQWIIADYNRKQEEKRKIPLCFEAVDAGATITLKCNGDNLKTATFQTSTDGQNWSDYTYGTDITLTTEDGVSNKVYFRAKEDNTTIARNTSNYL